MCGQKLFGWLGGYGLAGTAGFFEQLGFRPGRLFVVTASLSEVVSGVLIALRVSWAPWAGPVAIAVMIVAAVSVHWRGGLFAATNGIEVPLLYATGALALALTGAGPFSLDAVLGIDQNWTPHAQGGRAGRWCSGRSREPLGPPLRDRGSHRVNTGRAQPHSAKSAPESHPS